MHASRRQATMRLFTVVAFGALVLTGCGEKAEDPAAPSSVEATATAPADTGADPAAADETAADETAAEDTQAPADESPFAGTKQFVTLDKAWTEDGVTKLSMRLAEKKVNTQFDTWEIIPGTGGFTTVPMAKDARVLLTVPVRGDDIPGTGRAEPVSTSQAEFVTLLTQLDPRMREGAGFDLSFDGEGRVTKLQSLFRP